MWGGYMFSKVKEKAFVVELDEWEDGANIPKAVSDLLVHSQYAF